MIEEHAFVMWLGALLFAAVALAVSGRVVPLESRVGWTIAGDLAWLFVVAWLDHVGAGVEAIAIGSLAAGAAVGFALKALSKRIAAATGPNDNGWGFADRQDQPLIGPFWKRTSPRVPLVSPPRAHRHRPHRIQASFVLAIASASLALPARLAFAQTVSKTGAVPATTASQSAPVLADGQDPESPVQRKNETVAAPDEIVTETPNPFSVQLNLDFTNAYFYRGILQQDDGLIVQPAAKLTINMYEHEDFKIDALLGTWNSFGENGGTNTGDLVKDWYESDLYAGLVITKDKWSLTTTYVYLTSPSDAFQNVQELDFTLAYDDSEVLGGFALHPYALLAVETGTDYSDGADSDRGTYLELGVAPGFSFDLGKTPVAVSFPLSVGLSLDDYYQNAVGDDDTFGFFQAGVKASLPLPFGDRYGKWTLNTSVSALFLGDHAADFNGGDDTEFIATVGLQLNF